LNSSSETLLVIEILFGFSILIQTIELLNLRPQYSDDGIWSWDILKLDFPTYSQEFLRFFLEPSSFLRIVVARLILIFGLVAIHFFAMNRDTSFSYLIHFLECAVVLTLFLLTILISLRFRGVFNGGSDYMTMIVISTLTFSKIFSSFEKLALIYLATQTMLSYFVPGFIKLISQDWKSGKALNTFFKISNPRFAIFGSWLVIIFECLSPLMLINTYVAMAILTMAFIFHLANFYFMGLNRFLWAWLAAYPAIVYTAHLFMNHN
jgi:hypothetical protein